MTYYGPISYRVRENDVVLGRALFLSGKVSHNLYALMVLIIVIHVVILAVVHVQCERVKENFRRNQSQMWQFWDF